MSDAKPEYNNADMNGFPIQVSFENQPEFPTIEFVVGDLAHKGDYYNALIAKVFGLAFSGEDADEYGISLTYQLEERHSTRFIFFDDNKGLELAIKNNEYKGYVHIKANIVKMAAVAAVDPVAPPLATFASKEAPPAAITSPGDAFAEFGGVDPTEDLELATAIRLTIYQQDEENRLAKHQQEKGAAPAASDVASAATAHSTYRSASSKGAPKKAKATKAKAPSPRKTKGGEFSVEQRILSSLKECQVLGMASPPRSHIASMSGYTNLGSKTIKLAMKKLDQELGFIEYPDKKTVRLTAAGAARAPSAVVPATSNQEAQERLKKQMMGKGPRICDQLTDGGSHDKKQVAARVGNSNVDSKGFKEPFNQMRELKIVEERKDGKTKLIRLSDLAFPLGRPGAD